MSSNLEEKTGELTVSSEVVNGLDKHENVTVEEQSKNKESENTEAVENACNEVKCVTEAKEIQKETATLNVENSSVVETSEDETKSLAEDTKSEVLESETDNDVITEVEASSVEFSSTTGDDKDSIEIKIEDERVLNSVLKDDDRATGKENIDKNVLDDDLIFVKPKDKDRNHCYWYDIFITIF